MKKKYILLVFQVSIQACFSSNETELQKYLNNDYSPFARPVLNQSLPVTVTFGFELVHLLKVMEEKQLLTLKVWLRMSWINELMAWDPRKFGNVSATKINSQSAWTPDIYLQEDVGDKTSSGPNVYLTDVYIYSSGLQTWNVPVKLTSSCSIDVKDFPFDQQSCLLNFGSWTSDKSEIDIKIDPRPVITNNMVNSSTWTILDVVKEVRTKKYKCCPSPYVYIRFTLKLNRAHKYYIFNLIIPCVIQMIIMVITFLFPPGCGERITIVTGVVLVFALYLAYVSEMLPKSSDATSLLSRFFMTTIVECTCALFATIFVLIIHFKGEEKGVGAIPDWARKYIIYGVSRYLWLQPNLRSYGNECLVQNDDSSVDIDMDAVFGHSPTLTIDGKRYQTRYTKSRAKSKKVVGEEKKRAGDDEERNSQFDTELSRFVKDKKDLKQLKDEVHVITQLIHDQNRQEEIEEEWQILAKSLDRSFIIIFLIIFSMTTLVFLIPPLYFY